MADRDETTPVVQEPRSGRGRGRCGLVLLLALVLAVALVPPIVRTAVRMVEGIVGGFVQVMTGIAVSVNAAVTDVFAAVEASEAVKEQLGEPLVFPPMGDLTFASEPAGRRDKLAVAFLVVGPRGEAKVLATLRTTEQGFDIQQLTVTPADGSPVINVIEPP